MSEKMRFFDPQLKEKADQELFNEPEWLINLRQLDGQMRVCVFINVHEKPIHVVVGVSVTDWAVLFFPHRLE